jgi:glucose-6-phosphate isomerase
MNSQIFGKIPHIDWCSGSLVGHNVRETIRTLEQIQGLFHSRNDLERMDLNTIVYRVHWYAPVPEGTQGGLFWGTTVIEPGRVGDEYFMTHGHFHVERDRAEYYGCIVGSGMVIMMDTARRTWAEVMTPGSLHYIPGNVAHRAMRVTTTKRSVNKALGRAYSHAMESPFWCQRNSFPFLLQSCCLKTFVCWKRAPRHVRPWNHAIFLTEIADIDTFYLLLAHKRSYFVLLGFGTIITVLTEFEPSRPTILSQCLENQITTSILAFPSTPLGQNV